MEHSYNNDFKATFAHPDRLLYVYGRYYCLKKPQQSDSLSQYSLVVYFNYSFQLEKTGVLYDHCIMIRVEKEQSVVHGLLDDTEHDVPFYNWLKGFVVNHFETGYKTIPAGGQQLQQR